MTTVAKASENIPVQICQQTATSTITGATAMTIEAN
jgi:hypothetical protein